MPELRVSGWEIEGFGRFHADEQSGIAPGLVVLHGPNEAGKSTLIAFLRMVLFGAPNRRKGGVNPYDPLAGGAHRGRLLLEGPGGSWTVARSAVFRRPAEVLAADGRSGGDELLAELLGGVSEALYNAVYAFGLGELAELRGLTEGEARDAIFSAGTTAVGSAQAAIRELDRRLKAIEGKGAGALLPELRGRLEALEAERAEAARELRGYDDVLRSEREAERSVEELDAGLREVEERAAELAAVEALRPLAERAREAETAVAALPQVQLAADAVARLEGIGDELRRIALHRAELAAAAERAERDREALRADAAVLAAASEIEALAAERSAQRERLDTALPEAAERLATAETELRRALERLSWEEAQLRDAGGTIAADDSARRLASAAERTAAARAEAARALDAAERLLQERRQSAALAEERLAGDEPASREDIQSRLERAGSASPSGRGLWALPVVLLLSAVVLVAAAFPSSGLLSAVLLISGLAAALVGAMLTFSAGAPGADAAGGRAALELELRLRESWEERRDDLDRARIAVQAAEAERGAGRARLAEAEAAEADAVAAWERWRAEAGVPADLGIDGVLEFIATRDAAREALVRRDQAKAAVAAGERRIDDWDQRIEALAARLGQERGAEPLAVIERLQAALEEAREQARRLAELAAAVEPRAAELARLDREGAAAAAAERELLERAGVADAEAFRIVAAQVAERDDHARAIAAFDQALVVRGGDAERGAALRARLAAQAPAELDREAAELAERRGELNRERTERAGDLREARLERARLERAADLQRLAVQRAALDARFDEAVRELRRLAAARELVRAALRDYVRRRQPAVLLEAGAVFGRLTAGRYEKVVQDEDDPGALRVLRRDGRLLGPEALSRGTQQQLYMALRLGVIAELRGRGAALPLLLDDVLAEWDPERSEALARELAAVAEHQQVLFFTCRPETRELLERVGAAAQVLEIEAAEVKQAP